MTCTLYALALAAWMAIGGAKPADNACNGGLMDNCATATCNGGWPDM